MNNELKYSGKYTPWTRKQLIEKIEQTTSKNRFQHLLGVEETAVYLAEKYDGNVEKASIVALLHDNAKERPAEEMRDIIISENLNLEMLNFGSAIWHGPTGAVLAKREYGIHDCEILDAIAHHTVGETQMALLTQIIFVADYIEPTRDYEGVQEARELAEYSLEETIKYIIKETIMHLIDTKKMIYPKTIDTYNSWINK